MRPTRVSPTEGFEQVCQSRWRTPSSGLHRAQGATLVDSPESIGGRCRGPALVLAMTSPHGPNSDEPASEVPLARPASFLGSRRPSPDHGERNRACRV